MEAIPTFFCVYLLQKVKILQLLNEATEEALLKMLVALYVNENTVDRRLLDLDVPRYLKYSGPVYRIVPLKKETIQELLKGKSVNLKKQPVTSWSKSTRGIKEVMYGDEKNKFKNSVVLKSTVDRANCIVDVTKFSEKYPGIISNTQYSNYEAEEEVICKNFLTTITKKDVDGVFINGKGTKL